MILYTYFPAEPCGPQQNWGEGWTASPLPSPCGGCLRSSGVVLCFCTRMPWVYCLHFIRCRATNSFLHCRETGAPNLPELQMAPPYTPVLFISAPLFNAQPHKHIPKKSTSAFRPNKKANPHGFQNVMNKDTCPENFSALSPPASQIASSETRLVSFRSGSDLWIIQISYENLYWGL